MIKKVPVAKTALQVVAVLVIVCTLVLTPLLAKSVAAAQPITQQGLSISPVRTQLTIAPGTVQSGQLTVYNTTTSDMTVAMSAEAFGVSNQKYDYVFNPASKIVTWVHFDSTNILLSAGKSRTVDYNISVPLDTEPGGQYISLFAQTELRNASTGVSSGERVGLLLYITVDGNLVKTGHVLSLTAPWLVLGPSTWTATIQNTGTVHFTSTYSLSIKTLWGLDVSSSSGSSVILPSTIRLVQGDVGQLTVPGVYKLMYTINLGDSPSATLVRYIIYMPMYVWIILIILLLFVASRILRTVRMRREKSQNTT